MDEQMQVQIGTNQSRFRRENEKLELAAERFPPSGTTTPFLCECPDVACTDVVMLTMVEYERVREEPARFLYASGHQTMAVRAHAALEVDAWDGVCIADKIGAAGVIALDTHGK